jgi:23S rRNA pseudouridine2605 synthase
VPSGHEYYLFNKPIDVLSSCSDDRGRKTISDFLPQGSNAVPVGRLDLDTTGVLILTSDGELHFRLTHPSFGIKKIYKAKVAGDFDKEKASSIIKGVEIEGFIMKAEKLSIINQKGRVTDILIVLNEGRKREIKELIKAVGCRVVRLERIAFGNITCDGLAPGEIRPLTPDEIKYLKKITDLNNP